MNDKEIFAKLEYANTFLNIHMPYSEDVMLAISWWNITNNEVNDVVGEFLYYDV
jgi:hypothetical protein